MGNRITLEPTVFENHRTGKKTYGYRLYDDYGQMYDNTFEEGDLVDSDIDFLEIVLESGLSDDASQLFDFIAEYEGGMSIGKTYYDWDEIKHLFKDRI